MNNDNLEKSIIDSEVKKRINEEGYDENAAVLIGKKEEMPNLEAKLENEGRTVDIETYIKMHKEILVQKDVMERTPYCSKYNIRDAKIFTIALAGMINLYFCDKDKNLAFVKINPSKIADLNDINENLTDLKIKTKIEEDLTDLGFNLNPEGLFADTQIIVNVIQKQEEIIQDKNKQERKEKFDF